MNLYVVAKFNIFPYYTYDRKFQMGETKVQLNLVQTLQNQDGVSLGTPPHLGHFRTNGSKRIAITFDPLSTKWKSWLSVGAYRGLQFVRGYT